MNKPLFIEKMVKACNNKTHCNVDWSPDDLY